MVQQASQKISELTELVAPAAEMYVPVVIAGQTYKTTISTLYGSVIDAVGDGVTDDTVALQAAITAALAAGSDGMVYLNKTYATTGLTVTGSTGLTIYGPGGLFLLAGSNNSVLTLSSCTDTTIDGITIDGNRDNQTGIGHGIEASDTDGLVVRCRVTQIHGTGVYIGGASHNIRIRILAGTEIDHLTDEGIFVSSVTGVNPGDGYDDLTTALIDGVIIRWHGLTTTENWKAGIHATTRVTITNPRIQAHGFIGDTSAIGIRLGIGATRSTIQGGFIFPGVRGNGIVGVFPDFTDATEGVRIEANDCVVSGISPHGSFWGTRVSGVRNRLHHMVSDQCAYGFYLEPATGFSRITECGASGTVGPGVGILVGGDNCWLDGCYIRNNNHYGVEVAATAASTTITRCELSGNVDAPILDGGTGTRVLFPNGSDGTSESIALGALPPSSGLVRLGANQGGIVARTSSGANAGLVELTASDNINLGDSTDVPRIDAFCSSEHRWAIGSNERFAVGDQFLRLTSATASARIYVGTGTPEGVVSALAGSVFLRTDGGASQGFYVKESGVGNAGWVAK